MFNRARLQLALWFAAAMAITIISIGAVSYFVLKHTTDHEIDSSILNGQGVVLANTTRILGSAPPSPSDGDDHNGHSDSHGATALSTDVFVVTTNAKGDILTNVQGVDTRDIPFAAMSASASSGPSWADVDGHHERYRVLSSLIDTRTGPVYLHVARSLAARDSQLRTLAMVFGIGGLAAVAISVLGGLWLAGRALVPIRQALDTQRRFVSDASHELRTPIAVVQANNELVLRHPDSSVEANLDQLEAIAGETEHMTRLVEDLLTLARADEGRVTVARETVDFGGVVEEVTRDMGALAEMRGVGLSAISQPASVVGDVQRLRQLVVILVDNALKYTAAGGTVAVTCRRAGRRLELRVADTGSGIAPEHQKRIFDRFFRVDEARKRTAGGSGLGLAIAKWIVEAHHGRITVESAVGKGATFVVRLPLAE